MLFYCTQCTDNSPLTLVSIFDENISGKVEIPKSESQSLNRNSDFDIEIGILGNYNIEISTKLTYSFVGISVASNVKKDFRGNPNYGSKTYFFYPGPLSYEFWILGRYS
jgi:hypothetical protein